MSGQNDQQTEGLYVILAGHCSLTGPLFWALTRGKLKKKKIPILRSLINHTPRLEELNLDLRKVALGSHHWSESACCLWQAKAETAPSIFTLRLKDVIDRKYSCLAEIYCPALEAPFRGLIAPTICTDKRSNIRRSTVCSYGCDSGHNLVGGSQSLVCQLNGLWQGTVPYCKRRFFIAYEMNN